MYNSKEKTYVIRVCRSAHNTINVFALNPCNELRIFFGALDVWSFNPHGRTGCEPYVVYETDRTLKSYFKSEAFKAMLTRFGIKLDQIKIELN